MKMYNLALGLIAVFYVGCILEQKDVYIEALEDAKDWTVDKAAELAEKAKQNRNK